MEQQSTTSRRKFIQAVGVAPLMAMPSISKTAQSKSVMPAMYVQGEEQVITPTAEVVVPPLSVIAWNRIGYGPTPSSIAEFNALGLSAFIEQQLNPESIDDSELDARLANPAYQTLNKTLEAQWTQHFLAPNIPWLERIRPTLETIFSTFMRATYSKRQLQERMVEFWRDHFNVFADDTPIVSVLMHYDRDAIRPHALGNFRAMLEAVAQSPAMLYYLDNVFSSADGPNENYARELMELHTLGAENYLGVMDPADTPVDEQGVVTGFIEADVMEVARCLTGWSVANGHWSDDNDPNNGEFRYRHSWHDTGEKQVLGDIYPADQGAMIDGLMILDKLASHPGTARFICRKLCKRFISDNPPDALVQSAATVFQQNWQQDDQIKLVMQHILNSVEFQNTWDEKIKRPFDSIVGALRACEADFDLLPYTDWENTVAEFHWLYGATGHLPYQWVPPNGYPDTRVIWQGSTPLVMSWRVINWLLRIGRNDSDPYAVRNLDVLGTTLAAFPDPEQRTPINLATFWCERILGFLPPGEQIMAIAALLTQSDHSLVPISLDQPIELEPQDPDDDWPYYAQAGLRTMIGMIFMSPEYLKI